MVPDLWEAQQPWGPDVVTAIKVPVKPKSEGLKFDGNANVRDAVQ